MILEQEAKIKDLSFSSLKKYPFNGIPIRFVVTNYPECEIGLMEGQGSSIFDFSKKEKNDEQFNVALMIPTGIGAAIGGHAGDATPVAILLASLCDTLITHPNVVNASDLNELPNNALYVEGSIFSRLLMGTVSLQRVRVNKILVVINDNEQYILDETINAVNAAKKTYGLNCVGIVKSDIKLTMNFSSSGRATGTIENFENLCKIIQQYKPDAVAISSIIDVPEGLMKSYYTGEVINPWGGIEALLTHAIVTRFGIPSAHAPMMTSYSDERYGIVNPRMAAEFISDTFLQCVLKGLMRSPKIGTGLHAGHISCLVIPDKCLGLPTLAAFAQDIPVIAVRENTNCMQNTLSDFGPVHYAENYQEVAGLLGEMKSGLCFGATRSGE